jgi:cysteinyl-tRNA synthetase
MPDLKLHNTLSGKKENFVPINPEHVKLYACGPTVYNYAHIGNARMAVIFDLLVRLLNELYPRVTYASNITDVDDKIINASLETGEPIGEITSKYTDIYNKDMASLGVKLPDIQPRATEHIQDMIDMISTLIDKDHAYENEGHVLFNVPSYSNYGKLSNRNRDEQVAGARVEIAPYKKDAADFVLWKPSTDDQPGWDSPWGKGRPGWHIECSAMSGKHLGLPFDIHGGGADLKFPHHENEVAQSCCSYGDETDITSFAKYWVHNGFVTVSGEKMAKSIGNIALVHDLLESFDGEALRLTLLSAQYRQPLDWTENAINQSKNVLDRIYNTLNDLSDIDAKPEDRGIPARLIEALCDDLNTPAAIAELNDIAKEAARNKTPEAKGKLLAAGDLLGILQKDPSEWLGYGQASDDINAEEIEKLINERQEARKNKDFSRADEIRVELEEKGIIIEDSPTGPKWRKAG